MIYYCCYISPRVLSPLEHTYKLVEVELFYPIPENVTDMNIVL